MLSGLRGGWSSSETLGFSSERPPAASFTAPASPVSWQQANQTERMKLTVIINTVRSAVQVSPQILFTDVWRVKLVPVRRAAGWSTAQHQSAGATSQREGGRRGRGLAGRSTKCHDVEILECTSGLYANFVH